MRRNAAVRARIAALHPAVRLVICTITRGEVLYGLGRLPDGRRRRNLAAESARLFAEFPCLPVLAVVADRYAAIKREAERRGTPLDENDLWIAATALENNAVLVTADSDFQRLQ